MFSRRAWVMGGGVAVAVVAAGLYLWVEGVFLPEPEILIPELPPIQLSAPPPATTPGTVPVPSPPSPVSNVTLAVTGTASVTTATATGSAPGTREPDTGSGGTPTVTKNEGGNAAPANPTSTAPAPTQTPPAQDTRIAELEAIFRPRLESLQTQCEVQITALADQAIAEYAKLGKTSSAKATIAARYAPLGRKLQTTCERHFQALISSLETELRMNGLPLTMFQDVKSYYTQRVQEMKAILLKKAGI